MPEITEEINGCYSLEFLTGINVVYQNFELTIKRNIVKILKDKELSSEEFKKISKRLRDSYRVGYITFVRNAFSRRTSLLEHFNTVDKDTANKKIYIHPLDLSRLRDAKEGVDVRYNSYYVKNQSDQRLLLNIFNAYMAEVLRTN